MDINEIEITEEMMSAVALAQLYKQDPTTELAKAITGFKLKNAELQLLYKRILTHPKFQSVKDEAIRLEELTLVDDNLNTIMLYYNKILNKATFEGKYDTVCKILKEIRNLKAIENEETEFKIIIEVHKPKKNEGE